MTRRRKPPRKRPPAGGPERHALAMLERAVVERLTTRSRKAVERGKDLDLDEWVERELDEGEERSQEERSEILIYAIAQEFQYRAENGMLPGYVRSFLRRNPLYTGESSLEIAKAIWNYATWNAIDKAVDRIAAECDSNGEPRYLQSRDDPEVLFPNPDFDPALFTPPDDEVDL